MSVSNVGDEKPIAEMKEILLPSSQWRSVPTEMGTAEVSRGDVFPYDAETGELQRQFVPFTQGDKVVVTLYVRQIPKDIE